MLIPVLEGVSPVQATPTRTGSPRTLPSRAPSSSSWFLSSSISLPATSLQYLSLRNHVPSHSSSSSRYSVNSTPHTQLSIRHGSSSSLQLSLASEQNTNTSSTTKADKSSSVAAGITRGLLGILAFFFRAPVRLFRPVKISAWSGLQAIAHEKGKKVTPDFVRKLIRKEGWRFFPLHIFPPLILNSAIGFTLFFSYTFSSTHLTSILPANSYLLPFISGSIAGATQSLISAPLDNARLLLLHRKKYLGSSATPRWNSGARRRIRKNASRSGGAQATTGNTSRPFSSWTTLLIDSVFHSPSALTSPPNLESESVKSKNHQRLLSARTSARKGWSLFNLSLTKDALAFGFFFLIFDKGRTVARQIGLAYDGLSEDDYSFSPDGSRHEEKEKVKRSKAGLGLQSILILISGGMAGYIFGLVSRPFERARMIIWEGRTKWAEENARREGNLHTAQLVASWSSTKCLRGESRIPGARKQIGRRRRVTRSGTSARSSTLKPPSKQSSSLLRRSETHLASLPPSSLGLLRSVTSKYGLHAVLFASLPVLPPNLHPNPPHSSSSRLHRVSMTSKPLTRVTKEAAQALPPLTRKPLRALIKSTGSGGFTGRVTGAGLRVLTYVPAYAVGLLVYAVVGGDLK